MLALFDFAIVMPTLAYRLLLALGVALSVGTMSWPLLDDNEPQADELAAKPADSEADSTDRNA